MSKYRKNSPCSQGQSENCFIQENITSDDLVSVGQLQTDIMLMRTQQDGAQTAIDEMENEIDLLKAELIDLREKEANLKDNLKNESTKSSNLLQTNELLQRYIESFRQK